MVRRVGQNGYPNMFAAPVFGTLADRFGMPQYNTTAIVLRRIAFGETDNILTLMSKDHGRLSAIAKGARKPISRLSGATDLLACSKFALATGRAGSLQVVVQAEVVDAFPDLHKSVAKLAHAQYFIELMLVFTAEDDPHPELYQLLLRSLRLLEKADDPDTIGRWFEINMLALLGYAPDLTQCAVCHRAVPGEFDPRDTFGLSSAQGMALCPYHTHPIDYPDHSALTVEALWFLKEIEALPERASAVLAMRAPGQKAEDQARAALRRYIRFRADKELKSVVFLDSLRYTGGEDQDA